MNGTHRAGAMRGAALGLLLALLAMLTLAPAGAAHAAEEGSVSLGVVVANGDSGEAQGATGEVSLGIAVGQQVRGQEYPDPIVSRPGAEGEVPIGIAVGYDARAGETVEVSFDAGRGSFPGGEAVRSGRVPQGSRATAPPDPKRAGWSFAGWKTEDTGWEGAWDADGASAVPLAGDAWDFGDPVREDMTLHAEWSLRLDVTVPVEVGFGVNMADDGEGSYRQTIAPEDGLYAIKSRTVREVSVEGLATETREEDVASFFELPEGVLSDSMARDDVLWAWTDALAASSMALSSDGVAVRAYLSDGEGWRDTDEGARWGDSMRFTQPQAEAFTVPAFAYGGAVAETDPAWQGQEICERLPLSIALQVPKRALDVRNNIDGPKPITRLRLTVSARL